MKIRIKEKKMKLLILLIKHNFVLVHEKGTIAIVSSTYYKYVAGVSMYAYIYIYISSKI